MAYIFFPYDKLAGLSFNGGLMYVGLVPIAYDWHDFINTISMFRRGFGKFGRDENDALIFHVV